MSTEKAWTLTEAAKDVRRRNAEGQWSSVSRKTLQRALDKDKFPNAYRADGPAGEGKGPWMIPRSDLLAEGFKPGAGRTFVDESDATAVGTQPHTPIGPPQAPGETSLMDETSGAIEELQSKLDESERERSELLRRAEVAEAIAEERGRNLDDVRKAMKMLEAGQSSTVLDLSEDAPTEAPAVVAPARRKFFARFNR